MALRASKASWSLLALVLVCSVYAVRGDKGELGQSCSDASQCPVVNAVCANGKCACNASSDVLVGNKCILGVGARCLSKPCEAENSVCSENKFCVCRGGYQQTYNNTFCYKIPETTDDYCEMDHDCAALRGEAVCIGNKCGCKDTHTFHNYTCKLKVGTLGGLCIPETQACFLEKNGDNQNVECVENICKCKEGIQPSKDFMSCGADSLRLAAFALVLVVTSAKIFG